MGKIHNVKKLIGDSGILEKKSMGETVAVGICHCMILLLIILGVLAFMG